MEVNFSIKVIDKNKNVIINYEDNNLHLVSHSISVNKKFKIKRFKKKTLFF